MLGDFGSTKNNEPKRWWEKVKCYFEFTISRQLTWNIVRIFFTMSCRILLQFAFPPTLAIAHSIPSSKRLIKIFPTSTHPTSFSATVLIYFYGNLSMVEILDSSHMGSSFYSIFGALNGKACFDLHEFYTK